MENCYSANI